MIRPRLVADLDECVRIAAFVQEIDGYPGRRPRDLRQRPSARRHPVLDVATHYEAAIALYDSCGWSNAGEVTMVFGDGFELQSYVYVAPAPTW